MTRDATSALLGKTLPEWLTLLEDVDATARTVAAWAVTAYGPAEMSARPQLVGLVSDPEPAVRAGAASALAQLDPGGEDLPRLFAPLLCDADYTVRAVAAQALAVSGERAAQAIADAFMACPPEQRVTFLYALSDMGEAAAGLAWLAAGALSDADAEAAKAAARALEMMGPDAGPAASNLLRALSGDREGVASAAARALGAIRNERAVPGLLAALTDGRRAVRAEAAKALGSLGPVAPEVVAALAELLGGADRGLASEAIEALGKLGPAAVPVLTEALADQRPERQRDTAAALAKLGPLAAEAAPALIKVLANPDRRPRLTAIEALGAVGTAHASVLPALLAAVEHEDVEMRARAGWALAAIGSENPGGAPALIRMLADPAASVRNAVVNATLPSSARSPDVEAALLRVLREDPDDEVRLAVLHLLDKAGTMSPGVVTALIQCLDSFDGLIRDGAAHALGQIGAPAVAAVPALICVLQSPPEYASEEERLLPARAAAADALGEIGSTSGEVIPALVAAVNDAEASVRSAAISALRVLGAMSAPDFGGVAVSAVIARLKDENGDVRRDAAEALGSRGATAAAVVPALVGLLADRDWRVRDSAVKALGQIGPAARPAVQRLEALWRDTSICISVAEALDKIGALSGEERAALSAETEPAEAATLPALVTQAGPTQRISFLAVSSDGALTVSDGAEQLIVWDVTTGRELRRLDARAKAEFSTVTTVASGRGWLLLCNEKDASIWDLATGQEVQTLTTTIPITAAAFAPDPGRMLLAGGSSAILAEVAAARVLQVFQPDGSKIQAVAFSPDGRYVFAGSERSAAVWDTVTGEEYGRLDADAGINAAAFSHSGRNIVLADGSSLAVWDLDANEVRTFGVALTKVREILFAPDDSRVLLLGDEIHLRDAANGRVLRRTAGRGIGFGPRGPVALDVTGRDMQTIVVEDVASGQELHRLAGRSSFLTGAAFSPAGDRVLLAGWGGATVWDLNEGRMIRALRHPPSLTPASRQIYEGRWRVGEITSAAFSPDATRVLTGASDHRAILWEVATGRPIRFFHLDSVVEGVAISPDGKQALLGGTREAVLFDLDTGSEVYRFTDHQAQVRTAGFSQDGSKILTGSVESILWDAASGKELQRMQGQILVNASALSPDGAQVLAGVQNTAVCWDCATGEPGTWITGRTKGSAMSEDDFRRNRGHTGTVAAVAFSPDGTKVLTGGTDGSVLAWELAAPEFVYRRFEGHSDAITGAVFSPDGRRVLTASLDGAAILWDFASSRRICTLLPFKNGSWAVVDPEGRFDTDDLREQTGYAWVFADDPLHGLPPEIFMRNFYEPHLLPRLLAGERFPEAAPLGELNRVQPRIEKLVVKLGRRGDRARVRVTVAGARAEHPRGDALVTMETGVYDLRLFRDDQLVAQWPAQTEEATLPDADLGAWRAATHICGPGASATASFVVKLPATRDASGSARPIEFSAYAFNADHVKSAATAVTFRPPESELTSRPRAYLVAVGVNAYESRQWDLQFAASDAARVQEVVGRRLQGYEVLPVTLISDYGPDRSRLRENGATKARIRSTLKRLAGAPADPGERRHLPPGLQAATPDDLVLIFFAGHGYTDPAGVFYFLPHDIGQHRSTAALSEDLLRRAISSDELSAWIRPVDAGTIMMIFDTCHAEGAVEPPGFKLGPFGSRGLGQMAFDKGMRVLAASQSEGSALESASIKQGLLTYALIEEGLEGARAAQAGTISLSSWLKYGADRVPHLYREVLAGRVRDLKAAGSGRASREDAVQQPTLFDFTRSERPVVFDATPIEKQPA